MEIKYWSDIACPFCYIGSTRMKKAMKAVGIYDDTKLELKAFQLNPLEPTTANSGEYINHFTGGRKELEPQARQQMAYITSMAKGEGLKFNLDKVVPTNTMDAHRLIKFAEDKGARDLVERLISRLYQVYFTDGKSIADHAVLTQAATEVGMNEAEVKQVLSSNRYQREVRADELEAQQAGIQAAPFFVINNKYGISGAQPYEIFIQALQRVKQEEADQ